MITSCKKETNNPNDSSLAPVTTIGSYYQGGIVFYLENDGQHGLVITEHDLDTCSWSNGPLTKLFPNTFYSIYGMNYIDIGAGQIGTNLIIDSLGTSGNYAAKVCDNLVLNGYSDWFLPSRYEMQQVVFSNIYSWTNSSDSSYYGHYWTTCETSSSTAQSFRLYQWPAQGDYWQENSKLALNIKVRAIRKF